MQVQWLGFILPGALQSLEQQWWSEREISHWSLSLCIQKAQTWRCCDPWHRHEQGSLLQKTVTVSSSCRALKPSGKDACHPPNVDVQPELFWQDDQQHLLFNWKSLHCLQIWAGQSWYWLWPYSSMGRLWENSPLWSASQTRESVHRQA